MNTKLSTENPHGYNRYGFAWENIPEKCKAHLDFGCWDAFFLKSLDNKFIKRVVGVDVSPDAIRKANNKFPEIEAKCITGTIPLPFEDKLFSSISVLDVLEHICEQKELIGELHRILDDDGVLIITVPGRHFFSFLDMGNLKFCFPGLHKWYYCLNHSREEYEYRYVSNPEGLIGDVSDKKRWHEHFSKTKLRSLLETSGFRVVKFDGSGFFMRVIYNIKFFIKWIKFLQSFIQKLIEADFKLFKSANLFCIARKEQIEKK